MNLILLVVTALAVVNPARTRLGMPEGGDGTSRPGPAGIGSLIAVAAVAGLAAVSGPMLDALEITPETFRIAAGFVLLVAGVRSLVWPRPAEEPVLEGWRAALWPVAFPRLITPEAAALAVSAGSSEGVVAAGAALAAGIAVTWALAPLRRGEVADAVLRWAGTLTSVVIVLAGTFLMIDGIRDV